MGKDSVDHYVDADRYEIMHDRDNSDYVYLSENLMSLSGNKFHKKKNHVNKFKKNYDFEYQSLDKDLAVSFLELQETWCELRDCVEDPDLLQEDRAIYEAISHYKELGFRGARYPSAPR